MLVALTRGVSPSIDRCELTHLQREAIDLDAARKQHRSYEECLVALGCALTSLPAEPEMPDCVFVEDIAVVLDEFALVTRPGAPSRRAEIPEVERALREYRELQHIRPPGTLDGGDVLVVGRDIFIGLSARTNEDGFRQARAMLEPAGYSVTGLRVIGCLHLKSAVGRVSPDTLLVNGDWVDTDAFGDVRLIEVDPSEPGAAGALPIGDVVVYPSAFARTRDRLAQAGIETRTVDLSELAKAEAGVTCCSLIFRA